MAGEKRIALVVGNQHYSAFGALATPINDAQCVRDGLEKLGFEVRYYEDLTRQEFIEPIEEAATILGQTGNDMVFYYAGHGCAIEDELYLVPIDGSVSKKAYLARESYMKAESIIENLTRYRRSRSIPIIFIFDCCRVSVDQARGSGGGRGMSFSGSAGGPTNVAILYSTAKNRTASDGTGNGAFTQYLLNYLSADASIADVASMISRDLVNDPRFDGAQVSWFETCLEAPYRLLSGPVSANPNPTPPNSTGRTLAPVDYSGGIPGRSSRKTTRSRSRSQGPDFNKATEHGKDNFKSFAKSSMRGWAPSIDDTCKLDLNLGGKGAGFFGFYCAYEGGAIAKQCSEKLHLCLENDENFGKGEYEKAIRDAFIKFRSELGNDSSAGSSAFVIVTSPEKVYIATAGKTRAILRLNSITLSLPSPTCTSPGFGRTTEGFYFTVPVGSQDIDAGPEIKDFNTDDVNFVVMASEALWEDVMQDDSINHIGKLLADKVEPYQICEKILEKRKSDPVEFRGGTIAIVHVFK